MMPDVPEALSRLAVAFYNAPSEKMTVIGVIGALHASQSCQVAAVNTSAVEMRQALVFHKLLGHTHLFAWQAPTPSCSRHPCKSPCPCCVPGSVQAFCRYTAHARSSASACAGSAGKSTTCWYVRGIFEDWALPGSEPPRVCVVGMAGSLENAVDVLRMDRQGDLWEPEEDDPTLERCARGSFKGFIGARGVLRPMAWHLARIRLRCAGADQKKVSLSMARRLKCLGACDGCGHLPQGFESPTCIESSAVFSCLPRPPACARQGLQRALPPGAVPRQAAGAHGGARRAGSAEAAGRHGRPRRRRGRRGVRRRGPRGGQVRPCRRTQNTRHLEAWRLGMGLVAVLKKCYSLKAQRSWACTPTREADRIASLQHKRTVRCWPALAPSSLQWSVS